MAEVEIKVSIDGVEYSQEQLKNLAKNSEKAADGMEDLGKKTKKTAEETTFLDDIKGKFSNLFGGLKKAANGFKTLRGAIISTGIGALIAALGSLVAYFTSTEEGSKKLAIATEALSLLWGKLLEVASGVGEAIVNAFTNPKEALIAFKDLLVANIIERFQSLLEVVGYLGEALMNVFSGEFSAALESVKNAGAEMVDVFTGVDNSVEKIAETAVEVFEEVKTAVQTAVAVATELVEAQRAIRNQQQKLTVDNAKLTQDLEFQKKIAEDTTLTYEERSTALENVGNLQIKLAENVAAQAKAEEDLLKLNIENANTYEEREELETQLAEATASRIESETALGIVKLEAGKLGRELDEEEVARKKSIDDTIVGLRTANIADAKTKAFEELRIAEETALAELDLLKATEEEKQKVRDEFSKAKIALDKATSEAELQITQETLGAVGDAFGEGTLMFKAFKSAETIISTYSAAQKAYESAVAVPLVGSVLGPIAAAAAVSSGLKTLQQISSTQIPEAPQFAYGGPIGGPSHSGGGSLIEAEGGEFMINKYAMQQPGVGQIASALNGIATPDSQGGNSMAPIKTFVVADDVTSAQEATQKIKNLSRL